MKRNQPGRPMLWASAALAAAWLALPVAIFAGPYSSAQANTTAGASDTGVGAFVTAGGSETGTASGNILNPRLVGWATGVASYAPSPGVSASFQNYANALGPVGASSTIVSLGDLASPGPASVPGQITLTFVGGIGNGTGADFAVFENGFLSGGKLFAELAYVEVSSDGLNFARFASISETAAAVGAYGTLDATGVYNLAGKHAAGWGTPFDLASLAGDALVTGGLLDLNNIGYVRLVDIPGNGFYSDSLGHPIYDAWLTTGSGGLDLDAIGVLHGAVAVPEPSTWALLGCGIWLVVMAGRRAQKRAGWRGAAGLILLAPLAVGPARAMTLAEIQYWAGTGTNRAAMVIQWRAPEVRNNTRVSDPGAEKTLVWGFRWNGAANAEDMFNAILAADPRLFAVVSDTSTHGKAVFALGYDLDNNRVFGLRDGTNLLAPAAFTNGLVVADFAAADTRQSLDPADAYWGGWYGPGWELWQEAGGNGGFDHAPDCGPDAYWTPDDPANPWTGNHGQWHYADWGLDGLTLHDGSWIGWSVAAGGLDFMNPEAPGTVAWSGHKHAPTAPAAAPAGRSPFAATVVAAQGTFGASPYDDPASLLGMPATQFYDPWGGWSGGTTVRRVKLIEPAYNLDPTQTQKLITTLNSGSAIIVQFESPVTNDPANPYGVDLLVFGNAFYTASGFVNDAADLNTLKLTGGIFSEPAKVSVSPGFTGLPGEAADDPATWPWYRYDSGPFGDTEFPTQGFGWDRARSAWTAQPMDFTKPVNPALTGRLGGNTLTAADAVDFYAGSGGGTGFDLAAAGFSFIRYVKVEGVSPDWAGGEIDAMARVRPMVLGECLVIAPENLTKAPGTLYFQEPAEVSSNAVQLTFASISEPASVSAVRIRQPTNAAALSGQLLEVIAVSVAPVLGTNAVGFVADFQLALNGCHPGNGADLDVLGWQDAGWVRLPGTFNAVAGTVTVSGLTNATTLAVVRIVSPALAAVRTAGGWEFHFTPVAGWRHTLERTVDFAVWTPVAQMVPADAQPAVLADPTAPGDQAFYRLRLERP